MWIVQATVLVLLFFYLSYTQARDYGTGQGYEDHHNSSGTQKINSIRQFLCLGPMYGHNKPYYILREHEETQVAKQADIATFRSTLGLIKARLKALHTSKGCLCRI